MRFVEFDTYYLKHKLSLKNNRSTWHFPQNSLRNQRLLLILAFLREIIYIFVSKN